MCLENENEASLIAGRLKVEEIDNIDWENYAEYEEKDAIGEEIEIDSIEEEMRDEEGTAIDQSEMYIKELQITPYNTATLANTQNVVLARKIMICTGCRWSGTRKPEFPVPCPVKAHLDEVNSVLLKTTGKDGLHYFIWSISCLEFMRLQQQISRWVCQSRYDQRSDIRLCTANKTCPNAAMNDFGT